MLNFTWELWLVLLCNLHLFYHKEVFFHPLFKLHKILDIPHKTIYSLPILNYRQDRTERNTAIAITIVVIEIEHACIRTIAVIETEHSWALSCTNISSAYKERISRFRKGSIIVVPRASATDHACLIYCISIFPWVYTIVTFFTSDFL